MAISIASWARAENVDLGIPKLLWKFDCNPKESKYVLGGQSTRNHIIATPMIYKGLVYVGVGEDPEHGEGNGHFWCIDPTKRSDVSPELAFNVKDLEHPIERHREQAVVKENGEVARPNPNSAAVWHYASFDLQWRRQTRFHGDHAPHSRYRHDQERSALHRRYQRRIALSRRENRQAALGLTTCSCACWGSALVVDDKVYIGNEDGLIFIFRLSPKLELLSKDSDGKPGGIGMGPAVYSTPIVAENVLFIATRNYLFAIQAPAASGQTVKSVEAQNQLPRQSAASTSLAVSRVARPTAAAVYFLRHRSRRLHTPPPAWQPKPA